MSEGQVQERRRKMGYISIHTQKVTKDVDGKVSRRVMTKHENGELGKQLISPLKITPEMFGKTITFVIF